VNRTSEHTQQAPSPASSSGAAGERLAPWFVVASYTFLVAAWIFGNPPYAAPDEWSHYLRAVSIGHGQLVGTPAGLEGARAIVGSERPHFLTEETYRKELTWVAQNTSQVHIPAGLTPGWFRCPQRDPLVSARCLHDSPPLGEARQWFNPTATYQPLPYLVPAVLSRITTNANTLAWLMRTGKALVSMLLVAAAIFVLWSPESGLLSLVGLVMAMTPMAVYMSATLNPSGLEIASAVAFFSALLSLVRDPRRPPGFTGPIDGERRPARRAWWVLGFSGFMLALSRLQGPLWILLDLGIIVFISGVRPAVNVVLRQRRSSLPALAAVLGGIVLNRLWEHLYGPAMLIDPRPLGVGLLEGLTQLPQVLREQIGVFDYLEFGLPLLAYALWGALAIALGVAALLVGSSRQRFLLFLTAAAALALPVVLVAASMRHTGFALQGRYVLPFSVVVALLAGEILVDQRERLRALNADRLFLPFAAGAALVQLVAWWKNAHRWAVGLGGPRWFFGSAEWNPPWGWWPWLVLAAGGACLLIATAARSPRS
jgi:Predicted membrane protein (DUF2142)